MVISSCWVGVLFLGFCCPQEFIGGCGSCVLPGREFFLDPSKSGASSKICF